LINKFIRVKSYCKAGRRRILKYAFLPLKLQIRDPDYKAIMQKSTTVSKSLLTKKLSRQKVFKINYQSFSILKTSLN